jgi:hypothetical protein
MLIFAGTSALFPRDKIGPSTAEILQPNPRDSSQRIPDPLRAVQVNLLAPLELEPRSWCYGSKCLAWPQYVIGPRPIVRCS